MTTSVAKTRELILRLSVTVTCLIAAAGCGAGDRGESTPPTAVFEQIDIEWPQGDPAVSPDLGGPQFDPASDTGWQTRDDFSAEGSPEAVKGGSARYWVGGFPNTLRIVGKDSNRLANSIVEDLCYESLLTRHSHTLEYIPRLASHWRIADDRTTFRYRINPRAHWWDGKPVIADDVIATWDLLMDTSILEPAQQLIFGKFERPRAVSKYLVEVTAREPSWRNFHYFSNMPVLPSHELAGLSGSDFREKYKYRPVVGSGPYMLVERDVKIGQHLTLRRWDDYWGWREPFASGRYNFDRIRLVTTEDYNLGLERAKKGEIDILKVGRAKDWHLDLPRLSQVQRGWLVRRAVYNEAPKGVSGVMINMRAPPLDDMRVRRALCHLYHRQKIIDKLYFGAYMPLESFFPGGPYANPDNPRLQYDPDLAARLLAEAGWSERSGDGILVRDGQKLELELIYSSKAVERYLSIFQEDCLKAGIRIYLKQLTRATRFQLTYGDRRFQLATQGTSGLIDPNPETHWLSSLADQTNNNNFTGFRDERVDELCLRYDRTFDLQGRISIIREIDARVWAQYPCVLGWSLEPTWLIYWNRFGQPPWYLGRVSSAESVLSTWWVDPAKEAALRRAKEDGAMSLDPGRVDVHYWNYAKP